MAMGTAVGLGADDDAQLSLPLKIDTLYTPLAVFDNGDWIGRIHSKRGIAVALTQLQPESHRDAVVSFLQKTLFADDHWLFVYVRDGNVVSVLGLEPGRVTDTDAIQWNYYDDLLFFYFPRNKDLAQDPEVRGAWLWWLYDVFNVEDLPLEDQFLGNGRLAMASALRLPMLMVSTPQWLPVKPHQAFHVVAEAAGRLMKRMAGLRIHERGLSHGWWLWTIQGHDIRFSRHQVQSGGRFGPDYFLVWDSESQLWRVFHDAGHTELLGEDSDLVQLFIGLDLILLEEDFEGWLDAHITPGKLLYNSEPFELLNAVEPPMMEIEPFLTWIGQGDAR